MPTKTSGVLACSLLLGLLAGPLTPRQTIAATDCQPEVGQVLSLQGRVEVQRADAVLWQTADLGSVLCEGDSIRAGELSRAAVMLLDQTVLRVDQRSTLRLLAVAEESGQSTLLRLARGALQLFSRTPRRLDIDTPYLNGSIEGTEFVIRVEDRRTTLTVFEGRVVAGNEYGRLAAGAGESLTAVAGQPPQPRIVVRPRDAVQWALYYPPVLAAGTGPPDLSPALRGAVRRADAGDTPGAFARLSQIDETERDAPYHLYRAALLLSVGRAARARTEIDRALALDPEQGLGFALRAVIHVAQNERAQALADARRAVELSPSGAASRIALSYAQQAGFQISQARDTLLEAVERQPQDPLAWARLAELWLMLGHRERALQAAQRALSLAPELERTQLVLGFAALAGFEHEAARAAFERAVALSSADPLAHLGLGLAEIAGGELAAGRRRLEAAVALDPNSALLRAYLGKAYFEEKRPTLADEQFALGKQLDPLDPTAFLYDGIGKQTQNRPVEALRELEASIERNDSRAAYRGRLLLDQDRAARGTSLARVYSDLGFSRLGVIEAAESLALDPGNASAHRFLSDSYRDLRRHEVARVSELLQSQLLQDINVNPVQPSHSETSLNVVTQGGPASPGFNEFTPLFQRDETRLDLNGHGGSHDTYGGEAVVSALFGRYSLSAGGFFYDTEGFRDNHDLRHEVFSLYAQAALTPQLNLQAELRRRESDSGDIVFNFDPEVFFPDLRRELEEDSVRLGLRWSPDVTSSWLISWIFSDREENGRVTQELIFPDGTVADLLSHTTTVEDAHQTEARFIYQGGWFNATAGAAYARVEQDIMLTQSLSGLGDLPAFVDRPGITDYRGYTYWNLNTPESATWTLGLSLQRYDEDAFDFSRLNPKFGVQWDLTETLRLRGAYFEVVKPALAANRTVEPTQIAGFSQFFDDANATRSRRYGVGADWRAGRDLYLGAEFTRRSFEQPVFLGDRAVFEDRDEWLHRVYAYWTPTERWSLGLEAVYDRYESEAGGVNPDLPRRLRTVSLPFRAQYFHPGGWFVGATASYVDQEVRRPELSLLADGDSEFGVVDLAAGYRLPRRTGVASIAVQNLFDETFRYQDDSFRVFQDEPSSGPYIPERTFMLRLTLSF